MASSKDFIFQKNEFQKAFGLEKSQLFQKDESSFAIDRKINNESFDLILCTQKIVILFFVVSGKGVSMTSSAILLGKRFTKIFFNRF